MMTRRAQKSSLKEFARKARREKLRQACIVCRLPADVLAEMKQAREAKIDRGVVVRWLKTLGYSKVTMDDYDRHLRGQHEQA